MTAIEIFSIFREASTFEKVALFIILGVAIAGLLYAVLLVFQILKAEEGTEKMKQLAGSILSGANAYLHRQFSTIRWVFIALAIFVYFTGYLTGSHSAYSNPWILGLGRAGAFLLGASFSAMVGYFGMNMAVRGNLRVAQASRSSFSQALKLAYRTGTVTGMLTDGLGLLGGTILFILFGRQAPEVLLGFGFGGTLLALFMRVGGGIYTKAADVGADLVGKVEKGIPEDDPRNAAAVADQVGDNVGDCAGMAADIFESYEVTIVASMILGLILADFRFTHGLVDHWEFSWILFPLLVRAAGVVGSIISTYQVRALREGENAMKAIHRAYIMGAVISVASSFAFAHFYVHNLLLFWAVLAGVILAISINYLTDYFTSTERKPVKEVAKATQAGPATTILQGLALGYESTVWAIIAIAIAVLASGFIFHAIGAGTGLTGTEVLEYRLLWVFYGVGLCGIGMLTLTGNNIAMDTYGPVTDNANGIGEMAKLEPKARQTLADLDAVGNTTKAITKGIAIASAVLAAVTLFAAFYFYNNLVSIDLIQYRVFVAFLIGGAIPFLFSSLTIRAVGRAAFLIVNEVRYQFANIKGVWEGTVPPDYDRVVSICTATAQKELLTPALVAIVSPIIIGLLFGLQALAGFLAGVILVGQLLAVFMANSGGAWDNAKKTIEDGLYGGKGSEAHKAGVVGDTVGDPLKDTAGPALNPLIKVINLVSTLVAGLVVSTRGIIGDKPLTAPVIAVVIIGFLLLAFFIWFSKREESFGREILETPKRTD